MKDISIFISSLILGFVLFVSISEAKADESLLICPAVYLSCDGPLANDATRARLHAVASKIVAENCFAEEAMRCYGGSTAAPTKDQNKTTLLRKKIASLQKKVRQLLKQATK